MQTLVEALYSHRDIGKGRSRTGRRQKNRSRPPYRLKKGVNRQGGGSHFGSPDRAGLNHPFSTSLALPAPAVNFRRWTPHGRVDTLENQDPNGPNAARKESRHGARALASPQCLPQRPTSCPVTLTISAIEKKKSPFLNTKMGNMRNIDFFPPSFG